MNSKRIKPSAKSYASDSNCSLTSNWCRHVPHTLITDIQMNRICEKRLWEKTLPLIVNFKGL